MFLFLLVVFPSSWHLRLCVHFGRVRSRARINERAYENNKWLNTRQKRLLTKNKEMKWRNNEKNVKYNTKKERKNDELYRRQYVCEYTSVRHCLRRRRRRHHRPRRGSGRGGRPSSRNSSRLS